MFVKRDRDFIIMSHRDKFNETGTLEHHGSHRDSRGEAGVT